MSERSPPLEANGRTALVTGAGSGIGRATALRLHQQGFRLVLVGRTEGSLHETASMLSDADILASDVRDPRLLERLQALQREITVIVHGAMPVVPAARVQHVSPRSMSEAMEMVTAAGVLTGAVVPAMQAAQWGRVVFLGSKAAELGGPGQLAYAAAKAALVGMMRVLAVELGPHGATSNLLSLGLVHTARVGRLDASLRARIIGNSAVGRAGTPEEVASMVGYLCRAEAGFVTGAVLDVSGGAGLGRVGPRGGH